MWTQSDLDWLEYSYPTLQETKVGQIEGFLTFSMLRTGGQYLVNPSDDLIADTSPPDYLYISDTYEILLTWPDDEKYPKAHETGGKLAKTAARLNKSLLDMHQNDHDGALCLAAAMDLERTFRSGFEMGMFIEELLIPYLFAQSNYDKTEVWLWGELSHGWLGLLEWLGRHQSPDDRDIGSTYKYLVGSLGKNKVDLLLGQRWRQHYKCLCGSQKKSRDCHPDIQRSISLLRNAITRGLALVPK